MLFYETDDEKSGGSRLVSAVGFTFLTVIIVILIISIGWILAYRSDIPAYIINGIVSLDDCCSGQATASILNYSEKKLQYRVTYFVFMVASFSFVGWLLLILFGGVGLSALPIDLINEYNNRPDRKSPQEMQQQKRLLQDRTDELLKEGERLKEEQIMVTKTQYDKWMTKRKAKAKYNQDFKQFKIGVTNLDAQHGLFELELQYADVNPLVFLFKLLIGMIMSFISVLWWLHILLYMTLHKPEQPNQPYNQFLNYVLIALENWRLEFFGTAIFACLALYLLWCVQKGNIKFGIQIPFLFQLHPMKVNETWMNSFLFNVILILTTSVGVTQFSSQAFSQYARFSVIDCNNMLYIEIFNVQIKYLSFFQYFYRYRIFTISFLIWSTLVFFYLLFFSKPNDKLLQKMAEQRKKIKKGKNNTANKYVAGTRV